MAKRRKMLGDIDSQECRALMDLIETQSRATLAAWAVGYAEKQYLAYYEEEHPGDLRLQKAVDACRTYLKGGCLLQEVKPLLKEAVQAARDVQGDPVAQAAARAVSAACATVQTPTNALGFLFYGAAAAAYRRAGLTEPEAVYDELAAGELRKALASLREAAVPDEEHPVKIVWNC